MGKKKVTPLWLSALEGLGISLGLYLFMQMLFALLLVKGTLGMGQLTILLVLGCVVAVLSGGLFLIRRCPQLGPLGGGLAAAGCFALVLLAIGGGLYGRVNLTGDGGVLLLAILISGVVTGLLGARKRGGKRTKKGRRA